MIQLQAIRENFALQLLKNAALTDHVDAKYMYCMLLMVSEDKEQRRSALVQRCKESGNVEVSYREGMVQFFSSAMPNLGFEKLKKAAMDGHREAKYVYSMLLICRENEEERKEGFQHFYSLRRSTSVTRCRKRVKLFSLSIWKNNPLLPNQNPPLCPLNTCASKLRNPFEDEADGILCEYCHGNRELAFS
ncbi:uncharacterized protein LOC133311570 [Gastrolobium bilobum]|uniref:uncharacterized protein LOC133311570 n=1 Tax=Gastrolobium bilobum TaxID=150636 RepID=UPI002AB1F549|nr:uncharacterized protein LOC133311570 [Gastrolobium bilobum]